MYVRKLVCTPGATTNIYGRKYRIQGQFSKSQGKCSKNFTSHILGLSISISYFLISEASKRSLEYHWSDNKFPTAIPYYCLTHNPISKKFPLNCSENCGAVIPREEIY